MANRIIGFSFPFRRSATQFPAAVLDEQAIDDSIRQIIETGVSERPMRPNAGSRVWQMVFENQGPLLETMLKREVRRAIREQEKRVTVVRVDVAVVNDGIGNQVQVDVVYKLSGRIARTTVAVDGRSSA